MDERHKFIARLPVLFVRRPLWSTARACQDMQIGLAHIVRPDHHRFRLTAIEAAATALSVIAATGLKPKGPIQSGNLFEIGG